MSKTQVDRLGERLRNAILPEDELRALNDYRQGFTSAYQQVVDLVRTSLGAEPTGRPAKSTGAIVEKLRRESIRLSQIQDIAGARIVVHGLLNQDSMVEQLRSLFERTTIVDRRERPSHGYRSVHVIAYIADVPVEIQVRTELQHHWAELSEKLSDLVDPSIKYGGGEKHLRDALSRTSELIAKIEVLERLAMTALGSREVKANTHKDHEARVHLESVVTQAHATLDDLFILIRTGSGS